MEINTARLTLNAINYMHVSQIIMVNVSNGIWIAVDMFLSVSVKINILKEKLMVINNCKSVLMDNVYNK